MIATATPTPWVSAYFKWLRKTEEFCDSERSEESL